MIPPALRHRRYRLLWTGLLVSVAGTRMQTAAVLWHINQLSGQPIALGGIGLATIIPILVFSLLAGAAADAFNRRLLMLVTQIGLAGLALLLGVLTLEGKASVASIYAIVAASGAVSAFDLPARQSLVPNLVPPGVLSNAFSLNSIASQFGSVVGPAIGGLVLARLGIAYAYFINAVSYLAVIAALLVMGQVPQEMGAKEAVPGHALRLSVRQGLRFVIGHPIILSTMLLDFFATFFSSATTLLPIFATDILGVGAEGYGWLVAAPSIGAGLVALTLAFISGIRRQGRVLLNAVTGFGLATILLGISGTYWLTFLALTLIGASDSLSTIIRNTIRQLQTPDNLRGRMTSVNQIFFMGGPQLGEVEAGVVGQLLGVPIAVISGGLGCLLSVVGIAARFPQLRSYDGDEAMASAAAASVSSGPI